MQRKIYNRNGIAVYSNMQPVVPVVTPWWVTGVTQSDGSFTVGHSVNDGSLGYRPEPAFTVTQSLRNEGLVLGLQRFFGVGQVHYDYKRRTVTYTVKSLDDLLTVIIPHFEQYPCWTGKQYSFLVFRAVVRLMKAKHHLTLVGYLQILDLSYFTHSTTLRTPESLQAILAALTAKFGVLPEYSPLPPIVVAPNHSFPHPDFIAGLTDGDGSLNVAFKTDRRRVVASYTVTMGTDDHGLLLVLQEFFGCGKVYTLKTKASRFQIENASQLISRLKPVLEASQLHSYKAGYLPALYEAWEILVPGGTLSEADLTRLVELLYEMNLGSKGRKLTQAQYRALHGLPPAKSAPLTPLRRLDGGD